jgi:dihydroorotate dehydrogenase
MNATLDDAFQADMLRAAVGADAVTVFNRLWDAGRQVAYGGWELSDRNLRVLASVGRRGQERSGTGNVISGRQVVAYARAGCSTVQCHTAFQLPLGEYAAEAGSRTARTLHQLVFDPADGLLAVMLEEEEARRLHRRGGELRFRDLVAA